MIRKHAQPPEQVSLFGIPATENTTQQPPDIGDISRTWPGLKWEADQSWGDGIWSYDGRDKESNHLMVLVHPEGWTDEGTVNQWIASLHTETSAVATYLTLGASPLMAARNLRKVAEPLARALGVSGDLG